MVFLDCIYWLGVILIFLNLFFFLLEQSLDRAKKLVLFLVRNHKPDEEPDAVEEVKKDQNQGAEKAIVLKQA